MLPWAAPKDRFENTLRICFVNKQLFCSLLRCQWAFGLKNVSFAFYIMDFKFMSPNGVLNQYCCKTFSFCFFDIIYFQKQIYSLVLQTTSLLIHSLKSVIISFRIFKTLSIPNPKRWEGEIWRECSPPTMCHMSSLTCHV